ncbi:hypothetical protein [Streptomyces sp. NPDC059072]|uniref:hypothetical protein n=1 Tax=unclassified Streptomyces TaxID=2593676 RepID=UPI003680E6FB
MLVALLAGAFDGEVDAAVDGGAGCPVGTHGTLDETAIARYRETGTVVAEWDCGPAGGDGDDLTPEQPPTHRP